MRCSLTETRIARIVDVGFMWVNRLVGFGLTTLFVVFFVWGCAKPGMGSAKTSTDSRASQSDSDNVLLITTYPKSLHQNNQSSPNNQPQPIRTMVPVFDVVRVDFPHTGVRHSRKVWNHVDEMRVSPDRMNLLARNGVRIGVGGEQAWPALRAVFDACDAQVRRDELTPGHGFTLAIHLQQSHDAESIFSYGRSGQLVGKTFEPGEKLLLIDYSHSADRGGATDLRTGFEFRRDRGELTWEGNGQFVQRVSAVDRHEFVDLRSLSTLTPGEFLVVGMGETSGNEYLLGARFFIMRDTPEPRESLYLITPKFVETRVSGRTSQ